MNQIVHIEYKILMNRLPECDQTNDNFVTIIKLLQRIYFGGISNLTRMFTKVENIDTSISDIQMKCLRKNFKGFKHLLKFIIVLEKEVLNEYLIQLPRFISRSNISETRKKRLMDIYNRMVKEYS